MMVVGGLLFFFSLGPCTRPCFIIPSRPRYKASLNFRCQLLFFFPLLSSHQPTAEQFHSLKLSKLFYQKPTKI
ncbi:hypothetical protein M431DRAFT_403088 [Trichoderma harzianum CBS 226.95]|uniref:Secreted protein n=1 Tax=Trichoderma harzianum CBS 226.95 TaxID=983964 RepID=A0A2T4AEL7_TRIHA|nr:hypothetical protein M431DRAFT_403088 [Trichoderma harzianum CBS 226.95]PTB55530.1 hypothetical protein M431DRAFT_403088 [Trichoderma harzianum CBS 226.95]